MKRLFLVSAIAAASISMSACGGGSSGGGSDKDGTPAVEGVAGGGAGGGTDGTVRIAKTGKAVPKEEANLGTTSGVWLNRFEMYRNGIPLDSEEPGELADYGASVQSVEYVSDNELVIDDCDIEGPITLTLEAFKNSINEEDEIVDADPSELPCNGQMEYEYFERSSTDYRVDMVCQGEVIGRSELKQISAQPQYNQGALSFTADSGESLTSNGGVCGMMMHAVFDEGGTEHGFGAIELVAPYEDTRIEMTMTSFNGLKEGVYQIGSTGGDASALSAMVMLDASSDDSDDDADDSDDSDDSGDDERDDAEDGFDVDAYDGTFTIESLDAYTASGSFDLIRWDESHVQGNFSIDLQ